MYNPTYLIKSRHGIFYFRYPLPNGIHARVSLSLNTRCPKDALRLARILEYHGSILNQRIKGKDMDHGEVMSLYKRHFREWLDNQQAKINKEGPLPERIVNFYKNEIRDFEEIIDTEFDSFEGHIAGRPYGKSEEKSSTVEHVERILKKYDLPIDRESADFKMMAANYKYAARNYYKDMLEYNEGVLNYS